jgi:hypothetical protein
VIDWGMLASWALGAVLGIVIGMFLMVVIIVRRMLK